MRRTRSTSPSLRVLLPAARALAASLGLLFGGCAHVATGFVADALSGAGSSWSSDDDPELVRDAAPFGLKTMESVLADAPRHERLLTSLAAGYTQYGYAFLWEEADRIRSLDPDGAEALELRAAKHFGRARAYGLRGLETRHADFERWLRQGPESLERALTRDDVALLYWTASAWALSIAASKLAPEAIADFPLVERLARWALALDESWNEGSIHTLMISIEVSRPNGDLEAAERHFRRALELDGGKRAGTYVAMAEGVAVRTQDLGRFRSLLASALAVDVNAHPPERLANVVLQRRAARLRAREEDLFLDIVEQPLPSP